VAGYDVTKDPFPIRTKINMVSGGETSGYGLLTHAREHLDVLPILRGPSKVAKPKIDELLHTFGLWTSVTRRCASSRAGSAKR